MHRTQETYIRAEAIVEELEAQRRTMHPLPTDEIFADETLFKAFCNEEAEIDQKLGYWEAVDELRQAELAVIDWAMSKLGRELANHPGLPVAQEMVRNIHFNPGLRKRVADISMRLAS